MMRELNNMHVDDPTFAHYFIYPLLHLKWIAEMYIPIEYLQHLIQHSMGRVSSNSDFT